MKQLSLLLIGDLSANSELLTEVRDVGHSIECEENTFKKYDAIIYSSVIDFKTDIHHKQSVLHIIINDKQILLYQNKDQAYLLHQGAISNDSIVDALTIISRDTLDNLTHIELDLNKTISKAEYQEQIYDWNNTFTACLQDENIIDIFERQVVKTPNNIALVYADIRLTYWELNEKINQLAHYLKANYQLQADDLVALCLTRNEQMPIALLAVMKAGAAYVPLDHNFPEERISYVLADTDAKLLLTNQEYLSKLEAINGIALLAIDNITNQAAFQAQAKTNPQRKIDNRNLAYIIYTSGTTGKPKGVMIEHCGLVNLAVMQARLFTLEAVDTDNNKVKNCLIYANYIFDAFVSELFTVIANGHAAYLISDRIRQDFNELSSYIIQNQIQIATIPPALLVADKLLALECLIVAGEAVAKHILEQYLAVKTLVINAYGPTEATVCSCLHHYTITENNSTNIGRPLNNTTAYVLDEQLKPLSVGSIGELYIGGIGIARGYLNLPELTAEKFIDNPFVSGNKEFDNINLRLYKTGDLVRYLDNGDIEYIGRNDFQVKIRGYRIELGEIEARIAAYPAISRVVVLAHETKTTTSEVHKYLVAFYVSDESITRQKLQDYLAMQLPEYMIPSVFIKIDRLPLTINGKLDRNKLLKHLDSDFITSKYDYSDYSPIEAYLADLWQDLIAITGKKIELADSFFGLGGHSLLVTKLILKIKEHYAIILTAHQIYLAATLSGLAGLIRNSIQMLPTDNKIESQIDDTNKTEYLISEYQLSIYFAHQLNAKAYTVPVFVELKTHDAQKAAKAFKQLVAKHPILSGYIKKNGTSLVHCLQPNNFEPTHASIEENQKESYLRLIAEKEFDCEQVLTDFRIIQVKKNSCLESVILSFTHHHLIADGYSIDLMISEYFNFYNEIYSERKPYNYYTVANLNVPKENNNELVRAMYKTNRDFSLPRCKDLCNQYSQVSTIRFTDKDKLFIRQMAKEHSTTINVIMIGILYLGLYHYTYEDQINMGIVFANRHSPISAEVIGCMINTLPMGINFATAPYDMITFINQVKTQLDLYTQFSGLPLQHIIESEFASDRTLSKMFNLVFASQYLSPEVANTQGFEKITLSNGSPKFDIAFNFFHDTDPHSLAIEFDANKYTLSYIKNFGKMLLILIRKLIDTPNILIKQILTLNKSDYKKIVHTWNNTTVSYPQDKTAIELFEEQVRLIPHDTAMVYENISLTYSELNARANQLAHYICRNYKVMGESLIILCLNRNEHMLIAILAVMKTGGAYVPLDPSFPDERIRYVLNDTDSHLILTNSEYFKRLSGLSSNHTLALDAAGFNDLLLNQPQYNLQTTIDKNSLAYVIYTSGTTGKPKGVMIEHCNLLNLIFAVKHEFALMRDPDQTQFNCLQYANYVFDAHVFTIFPVLCCGHTLFILSEQKRRSLDLLTEYLKEYDFYWAVIPPILIRPDNLLKVKYLIAAGDKTDAQAMHNHWLSGVSIVNAYGPTETTVCATLKHYTNRVSSINIGKPIANTTVYILNEYLQPVAFGVIGEIYIGGDNVARGYLNNADLTSTRFIVNPFQSDEDKKIGRNSRLYKTNDLARYLPNGELEYLGRNDFQVKIRGFRIECGEVENAIAAYSLGSRRGGLNVIKQNVVVALDNGDPSNKFLVAYYVADRKLDNDDIMNHLHKNLPEYMVPTALIQLQELPFTINGKLDVKLLPKPDLTQIENYTAPRNTIEEKLTTFYADLFGINHSLISVFSSFQRLGGNSLLAMQLLSQIKRQFNVDVSFKNLLEGNIANLSYLISGKGLGAKNPLAEAEPQIFSDYVSLSPAQERSLFFRSNIDNDYTLTLYHLSSMVNFEQFEQAWKNIINTHINFKLKLNYESRLLERVTSNYFKISKMEAQSIDDLHQRFNMANISNQAAFITIKEDNSKYMLLCLSHFYFDGVSIDLILKKLQQEFEQPGSLDAPVYSYELWLNTKLSYLSSLEFNYEKLFGHFPTIIHERIPHSQMIDGNKSFTIQEDINYDLKTVVSIISRAYFDTFIYQENFFFNNVWNGRFTNNDTIYSDDLGMFALHSPVAIKASDLLKDEAVIQRQLDNSKSYGELFEYYSFSNSVTSEIRSLMNNIQPEILFNFLGEEQSVDSSSKGAYLVKTRTRLIPINNNNELSTYSMSIKAWLINTTLTIRIYYNPQRFTTDIINKFYRNINKHIGFLPLKHQKQYINNNLEGMTIHGNNQA